MRTNKNLIVGAGLAAVVLLCVGATVVTRYRGDFYGSLFTDSNGYVSFTLEAATNAKVVSGYGRLVVSAPGGMELRYGSYIGDGIGLTNVPGGSVTGKLTNTVALASNLVAGITVNAFNGWAITNINATNIVGVVSNNFEIQASNIVVGVVLNPADGSALTNLTATNIVGVLTNTVALASNVLSGVALNPANAAALTNLTATNIVGVLTNTVALASNVLSGVTLNGANAANLTNIPYSGIVARGAVLTNGFAAVAALSNNVTLTGNVTNTVLTASRLVLSDANLALKSAAASGAVSVNADGSATTLNQVQALGSGALVTNGYAAVLSLSNTVTVAANLTNTVLTASRIVLSDANLALKSAAGSGAVPVNADGSASTFNQVQALGSGKVVTNGYAAALSLSNNVTVDAAITPKAGIINQGAASFASVTVTTNTQLYNVAGTNQLVTLPSCAASLPWQIFRFSSTNGYGSFILTNATGSQTIRDGASLSLKQIGIGEISVYHDGAHWWLGSKARTIFPNAQFSCSTNIPLTSANVAYPVTFDTVDFNNSQGIALLAGTNGMLSKMWITNSGHYEFAPSLVATYGGNGHNVRFWFRSSNTNVPASCSLSKGQNGDAQLLTVVFTVDVTEPTGYEIWASSDATGDSLLAGAAGGTGVNAFPAMPSVICPVKRISDPWP